MPEVTWCKVLTCAFSYVFKTLCPLHQGLRGDLTGALTLSLKSEGFGQSRPAELTLHYTLAHLVYCLISMFCCCFRTRIVSTRK